MTKLIFPVALVVTLAACGGGAGNSSGAEEVTTTAPPAAAEEPTDEPVDQSTDEAPASALRDSDHPSFPEPLVDPRLIRSGGPPPDGIPPVDTPEFVSVSAADEYLDPAEPVVALEINGDARAYPVQILVWHEIVNDTVGGVPVAVTYCPLCNSAVSFERTVDGEPTTFGTSGRLFNSALVMYDRATESLWTHFDGRAVVGHRTGTVLTPVPSPLSSWADFKAAYPDGTVLDRERTGASRPYGSQPYVGYDNPDGRTLFAVDADDRARLKERVVGVAIGDAAKGWVLSVLQGETATVRHDQVGETPVVILWKPGQASGIESNTVAGGRDVGSVAVFSPEVDGETLEFVAEGTTFRDTNTGSTWNIFGEAVDGALDGSQLLQHHHLDTFWFAWSAYQPETEIVLAP